MNGVNDGDEIVISGVGGCFPKANNLEELKKALLSNDILLDSRWPEGHIGVTNKIGKIDGIEKFDNIFFGINAVQANLVDPMQRMNLEKAYEAITDAGYNINEVRGRNIASLAIASIAETDNLRTQPNPKGYRLLGQSRCMASNRISYFFNFKGMSITYDANWLGSGEIIKMAYDAVKSGHCEAALVTATNLVLRPSISWYYSEMGLLSSDSSTKAFDADATGHARAESIVAFFIERKCTARRVYATIVGAASTFDGVHDESYLNINQANFTSFLEDCYMQWNVNPRDVSFIECYGSAVKSTDEVELNAVDEVFCKNRKKPLKIGSVKTNIGHTEPVSMMASIAKVIIAMETGKIPATLQYSKPNPKIPSLVEGRMEVVTKNEEWDGIYAAVNSFGLSSSFAHCLLKINPKQKKESYDLATLVAISGRTEEGTEKILNVICNQPTYDTEYLNLVQKAFAKSIPTHLYRGFSIIDKSGEIARTFKRYDGNKRQVWFVYSGMGSQWIGMGTDLMKLPIFASTINKCCEVLKPKGIDLMEIICGNNAKIFDNILNSFVGIAAIQIALTDVLHALGVVPDGIIGHSVGELGCAYADGCLTAKQMLLSAYSRGKASNDAQLINGMMAAVGLGYNEIKNQLPQSLEVACHNSDTNCTISGPTEDMEQFVKKLTNRGIFARLVNVANIAYHSRYIRPAAPLLLKYMQEVIPNPIKRSKKWICTSIPESLWSSELAKTASAEYLTNNLLSSVLFEEGCRYIPKDAIVIEIAPHGLLQAILRLSMDSSCIHVPLAKREDQNSFNFLLNSLGSLHLAGLDLDLTKLYPKVEYPIGRGTSSLAPLVDWNHADNWMISYDNIYEGTSAKEQFVSLDDERFKYCRHHKINNKIVIPVSAFVDSLLMMVMSIKVIGYKDFIIEDLRFRDRLEVAEHSVIPLSVTLQKGSGKFQITSKNKILVTGQVRIPEFKGDFWLKKYEVSQYGDKLELKADDFYTELENRGQQFQGLFRQVKDMQVYSDGAVLSLPSNQCFQTYLEAALQMLMFRAGEKYQDIKWPMTIQRINLSFENFPSQKQDVHLTHHYATNIVSMPGLQISNVAFETIPKIPRPVSFEIVDVVPLENMPCETIEKAINYTINLILQNFVDFSTNYMCISEISGANSSLLDATKRVITQYNSQMLTLDIVDGHQIEVSRRLNHCLVLCDGEMNDAVVRTLQDINVSAFVRTSEKLNNNSHFVTVASFIVNNVSYSFVRKSFANPIKLIKYSDPTLTSSEILNTKSQWHKKLLNHLDNLQRNQTPYLVSRCLPLEGILNFLNAMRSHPKIKQFKYVFILDEKLADVENNRLFYEDAFKKNLIVTVVDNGMVRTCTSSFVDFNNTSRKQQSVSNVVEGLKLEYIGINRKKSTVNENCTSIGNIDYIGRTKDGQTIMGMACMDKTTNKINLDPILRWNVPSSWETRTACNVPSAYATIYYALFQEIHIRKDDTVWLDIEYNDTLFAAINVVMNLGCTVFVTVDLDWQKDTIQEHFRKLNRNNIFLCNDGGLEEKLLDATNGNGVKVIITNRSCKYIECRLRCIDNFGKLVYFTKLNLKEDNNTSSIAFLKYVTLSSVISENILTLTDEKKRKLCQFVQNGINSGIVKPVPVTKTIITTANSLQIDDLKYFVCDSNKSYLVIGGSQKLAVDIVQWLGCRGARNVFVIQEENQSTPQLQRRINLFSMQHQINVTFITKIISSVRDAVEILEKTSSNSALEAVFNLESSANVEQVKHFLSTLRMRAPNSMFINFSIEATQICLENHNSGFSSYNVQYDDSLNFQDIIDQLDNIMTIRVKHIVIKNLDLVESKNEQNLYRNSLLPLPTSAKELLLMTENAEQEPQLLQMFSFGPKYIRDIPPVILVPGFTTWNNIEDFARKLLYPVFVTVLPKYFVLVKKIAEIFAEKIRSSCPLGPYNIVGISCGGILAVEIAKCLQRTCKTQVTLIDAAPDTIKAMLGCLDQGKSQEISLTNRVLGNSNVKVLENITDKSSLDSCFEVYYKSTGMSDEKSLIKKNLLLLNEYICEFRNYTPDDNLLEGEVILIRPQDANKFNNCGLEKYFKKPPRILLSEGDHSTMLESEKLIDIINDSVATT